MRLGPKEMPHHSLKDCEACGNILVPLHKKYCSECYSAIKTKNETNLASRLDSLEKRLRRLEERK